MRADASLRIAADAVSGRLGGEGGSCTSSGKMSNTLAGDSSVVAESSDFIAVELR